MGGARRGTGPTIGAWRSGRPGCYCLMARLRQVLVLVLVLPPVLPQLELELLEQMPR